MFCSDWGLARGARSMTSPSTMPVSSLREIRRAFDARKFDKLLSNPEFLKIFRLYGECSEDSNGLMEEIAPTLTDFFCATKEGNWKLHLDSVKWFFAYDHTNFAHYLPVYLVTMGSFKILTLRHISYWQMEILAFRGQHPMVSLSYQPAKPLSRLSMETQRRRVV